MIRKNLLARSLAALLLGGVAAAASAEDGFYAGIGAGQAYVDEGPYDDEDTVFSVFGGYQFNRHFAVEGGYLDLGDIEPDGGAASLDADTFHVTAVGIVPVNDAFAFYGKAGLHRWDADQALAILGGEDSGTDPTYGVGAQYRISERFALRSSAASSWRTPTSTSPRSRRASTSDPPRSPRRRAASLRDDAAFC